MVTFPILGRAGKVGELPYAFVEQFSAALMKNHGQSVARLANRGGLSWCELYVAMRGVQWPSERYNDKNEREVQPIILRECVAWVCAQ